tara:strand:+ start:501 stop:680 length:180 start_codon:yes stop_codon:yes gene_type:complete
MQIGDLVELRHGTIGIIMGKSSNKKGARLWEVYSGDRNRILKVYEFIVKRVISEKRNES